MDFEVGTIFAFKNSPCLPYIVAYVVDNMRYVENCYFNTPREFYCVDTLRRSTMPIESPYLFTSNYSLLKKGVEVNLDYNFAYTYTLQEDLSTDEYAHNKFVTIKNDTSCFSEKAISLIVRVKPEIGKLVCRVTTSEFYTSIDLYKINNIDSETNIIELVPDGYCAETIFLNEDLLYLKQYKIVPTK